MAHKCDWKIEPQSCYKLPAYLMKITKMKPNVDYIKMSEMKMPEMHNALAFQILGVTKENLEQAHLPSLEYTIHSETLYVSIVLIKSLCLM